VRLASLVAAAMVLAAAGPPVPRDESGFTKALADRFTAAVPGATVTVKSPRTLSLAVSGFAMQVSLDRVWDFCIRNREDCGGIIDDFVEKTSATLNEIAKRDVKAVDISTFRLVLRPSAYINTVRGQMAQGGPGAEPVVGPFAGDLWWMLVTDSPQTVAAVTKGDLEQEKLGARAAMEAGRANLEAMLPPLLSVARKPTASGVGAIQGDFYTSSRLLLHDDDWDKLAETFAGRLIAVAPDPRVLLYADFGVRGAYETMQRMAEDIASKSERPLSMMVVQWTPDGWKPVAR
jgi:hypothetical protein